MFKYWKGTCRKGENENTGERGKYTCSKKVGEVRSRIYREKTELQWAEEHLSL